eukprot:g30518.t1
MPNDVNDTCIQYLDRICHGLCTLRPDVTEANYHVSNGGVHLSSPQACLFTSLPCGAVQRAVQHAIRMPPRT